MGGKTDRRISIGQRISMGFREPTITEEVRQVIRDWKVGNIVFFSENVASLEQFSALCAELKDLIKAETGLPPLLMLDEEGGLASRLGGIFGDTPWPMAVGETDREENARSMGRVLGERLRMAGANMNLAPVLDCLVERESPVMACRPFSDDPKKVARLGRAWIEGAHEAGILTCGKHFPGHGRTRMDSHAALPVIDCSLEEMMETDLLPFREAIAAGTDALMSAHIVFPALEPEGLPATVSARILQGLVREKLGFDGLMISDGMEMQAMLDRFPIPEGVLRAMKAGIDIALICHEPKQAAEACRLAEQAAEAGELTEANLSEHEARIRRYKQKLADSGMNISPAERQLRIAAGAAKAQRVMLEAIRVVNRPEGKPFPGFGPDTLLYGGMSDQVCMAAEENLLNAAEYCGEKIGSSRILRHGETPEGPVETAILFLHRGEGLEEARTLASRLAAAGAKVTAVALDHPYVLEGLGENIWQLCAWQNQTLAIDIVLHFLRGEQDA